MAHSNLVKSVLRGIDIILEIGKAERGRSLRELSASLSLKVPTLHNLLRTLKARGFIRQCSGEARYVLGPTLLNLVAFHGESRFMAAAEKAVQSLFNEMGQKATITFSEPIGGEIQTILRMSFDQPALVQKPRRQTLHPYFSATALVFHAFGNEEDREMIQVRYPFQERAVPWAHDLRQFNKSMEKIRRDGYAFHPIPRSDRLAVAVPVLGKRKELLAIIGLSRENLSAAKSAQKSLKKEALNTVLKTSQKLSESWISLTENHPAKT